MQASTYFVRVLLLAVVWSGLGRAVGQTLLRGPYLQCGTATNMVIRWRTDVASDSRVGFGTNLLVMDRATADPLVTTDHEVLVPELKPSTDYFYRIGSANSWLNGAGTNSFQTAPPPGEAKPARVWVIGDAGTQTSWQVSVRDAYEAFAGTNRTDVWLMLGDNAYFVGTDAEYQLAVFDMYTNLLRTSVAWPTLGNHDAYAVEPTGNHAYFDLFTLPSDGQAGGIPSGTEHYYAFDYGRIHFICLDSTESSRAADGPMASWLTNDLAHVSADWIIAFWHHAPYSRGSHDSDTELELVEMRENIVPLLERGGVDLVLSGHSHSYERSKLITGHYGTAASFSARHEINPGDGRVEGNGAYHKPRGAPTPEYGTVYAVVGSSGQISGGPLDHPAMQVSLNQLGSLVLDITSNRLDALFLGETGNTNDWFTMLKMHEPPRASNLTATVTGDFPANLQLTGSDPGTNSLTFRPADLPDHGLLAQWSSGSGALTYAPAHAYAGPDVFTFRTHNGFLFSPPAIVTLNVLAPADANANHLPDYWETKFGLSDPEADADLDGLSNAQEYLANTNPTNAASVLRITEIGLDPNGQLKLTWAAVGGSRYRISYRDANLAGPFTDVMLPAAVEINPASPGNPSTQSFVDDRRFIPLPPIGVCRFYRVRAVGE